MEKDLIRWLYKPIGKQNQNPKKELINILFSHLYDWIIEDKKIMINVCIQDLQIYFYLFLFNKNNFNSDLNDDFNIMYHDSVVDLFIEMKDISSHHGSHIFNNKGDNANDLLIFMNNFLYIDNDYDYETDGDEEQFLIYEE